MRLYFLSNICSFLFVARSASTRIPQNHILWGTAGPLSTLVRRQEASSTPYATATAKGPPDAQCTNGPLTRNCWSSGFSVATDFDAKWPTTGQTVSYNLEITNTTCDPDGHGSRPCLLFNNQYPGPVISANWGDTLQINVKNSLEGNGTSLHFHGIRQLNSNSNDGVNGITECPLAPGDSKTYTFQCTQFGTTWYHSHYSSQYGDGAFGALIIKGPASSNYDVDLGPFVINELFYQTAYQIGDITNQNLQNGRGAPPANNLLINGSNKNANGGGSYTRVALEHGKRYRLRLINAGLDNTVRVSLDNHLLKVISADMVPVKPYTTNWVLVGVGQRYDVIFTANQTVGNYWFRASAVPDCASSNSMQGMSIFSYNGYNSNDEPASSAFPMPGGCNDERPLEPWVVNDVSNKEFLEQVTSLNIDLTKEQLTTNEKNIVVWGVNLSAINVDWEKPTLQYVEEGNTSYPSVFNLISIPQQGTWSYWIIQETPGTKVPIPHPIHLHGHDFYILGTGAGVFDKNTSPAGLVFTNPPRRDTAMLPGGGWLAIAFPADNPGAWLLHCHIAWHVSSGLGVQFLESKDQIPSPGPDFDRTCQNWRNYYKNPKWLKNDSGLKRRGIGGV